MTLLDDKTVLFVGGIARSGTTWAQLMIGGHPDVVTSRETHVIFQYITPLLKQFDLERKQKSPVGLTHLFDRPEFVQRIAGSVMRETLSSIGARAPQASVILEKTPNHIKRFSLIDQILGDQARLLHVIRDPRSVAASWQAAAAEPWGKWARFPVEEVARRWTRLQADENDRRQVFGTRYSVVKYEEILENPESSLARVFSWLGLDSSNVDLAGIVAANSLDSLREGGREHGYSDPRREERRNFFRSGRPDSWLNELTQGQIAAVEGIAGEQMRRLGYALHGKG